MKENASFEEYADIDDFKENQELKLQQRFENFLESRFFIVCIVVLIATSSFILGKISVKESQNNSVKVFSKNNNTIIEGVPNVKDSASVNNSIIESESSIVVGSKNGTKYHYPWCPGAKQISEKNKVTFSSIEEAKAKGYTKASNCNGLK